MRTSLIVGVALSSLITTTGPAAVLSSSVAGSQLVTCSGGGQAVVLAISLPDIPDHVSLGDATLRLDGDVLSNTEGMRVHVQALSTSWSGGTDVPVYDGLVGRMEVAAGAGARGVDVTNLLRGLLKESGFAGLVITPAERANAGFNESEAQALQAAFQDATLEVSYRLVPPGPATN